MTERADAERCYDLGLAQAHAGAFAEAERFLRAALATDSGHAGALSALGGVLLARERFAAAEAPLRRALAAMPENARTRSNLGSVLIALGRVDEAAAELAIAVAADPDSPRTLSNLALARDAQGSPSVALGLLDRALALDPSCGEARRNRGRLLRALGRFAEAAADYRAALAIDPADAGSHANLLFCLCYDPDAAPADVAAEHRRFDAMHAAGLADPAPHGNGRDPDRRLRIGYLSPDLRDHAVAGFLEPVLAAHDPAKVEVHAFADVPAPDAVTARLRRLCQGWHALDGLDDAAAAAEIRAQGIDILVDLAGHTAGGRPLALARRPAPVQATWIGYPNTTGLAAVDYRFTDAEADPPGLTEALHSEALVRLPHGFLCWRPPEDAPAPAAPPGPGGGRPMFGCFNDAAKVNDRVLAVWSALLAAVPEAGLLLKARLFGDEACRAAFTARLAAAGIDPARVDLLARVPTRRDHLALHGRVDVALDTFPYAGTTTTVEALWMGVPVVTLAGRTHVGRVGASLLTRVGLAELVADTAAGYVARAAALVHDRTRLAELRQGLRARMLASPLTDGRAFTPALEAVYRDLWRRWCR